MVLDSAGLAFISITSTLSVLFALSIGVQASSIYRKTERERLLSFAAAFFLLAVSYALLIPLAFGIRLPTVGYEANDILTYPPRIVIASIGLIIIALSYTPTRKVTQILYALIAILILFVILVMIPQGPVVPPAIDALVFALNVGLLGYVLYRMWQFAKPITLVFLGFLVLLVSQSFELIGSLSVGLPMFVAAETLRLVSFSLLFATFIRTTQVKPIVKRQEPS